MLSSPHTPTQVDSNIMEDTDIQSQGVISNAQIQEGGDIGAQTQGLNADPQTQGVVSNAQTQGFNTNSQAQEGIDVNAQVQEGVDSNAQAQGNDIHRAPKTRRKTMKQMRRDFEAGRSLYS